MINTGPPRAAQLHFCASARWSVTRRAVWGTKCRVASRFLADLCFFMTRRLTMSVKCRVASANSMIVPLTFRCRPEQWRDCLCGGRCGALLRPQRGIPAAAAGAGRRVSGRRGVAGGDENHLQHGEAFWGLYCMWVMQVPPIGGDLHR